MGVNLEYPAGLSEFSNNAESTNDAVSFVHFEIFERVNARQFTPHGNISLYMPETIENPTSVTWDGQALGAGGAGQGNLQTGYYKLKHDLWDSTLASMGAKLQGGSDVSGQDILAYRGQKILNPYLKMLFRGVNFRNFEMTFRFTPHTADESNTIFQICQEFRAAALPEEVSGGFKWKYPRELQITYKYQGRDHPWLNKFKRCVITDAHVNYASAGHYASMRNGFPAETELRLQFSEIDLLTRKDIETANGPSF